MLFSIGTLDANGYRLATATKRILSKIPLKSSHENIYTVPNILTFSRLVAAPAVGYLLVHNYHAAALSLFAYAGITDLVDGWIARKYQLQTVVGTIIDPMADKLLMTIGVACLAVNGSLPGKYLNVDACNMHKCLTGFSVACRYYPRSRCRSSHLGYLLPLDLASTAQDYGSVLGLFSPLG